jgi:hypothetical protein
MTGRPSRVQSPVLLAWRKERPNHRAIVTRSDGAVVLQDHVRFSLCESVHESVEAAERAIASGTLFYIPAMRRTRADRRESAARRR